MVGIHQLQMVQNVLWWFGLNEFSENDINQHMFLTISMLRSFYTETTWSKATWLPIARDYLLPPVLPRSMLSGAIVLPIHLHPVVLGASNLCRFVHRCRCRQLLRRLTSFWRKRIQRKMWYTQIFGKWLVQKVIEVLFIHKSKISEQVNVIVKKKTEKRSASIDQSVFVRDVFGSFIEKFNFKVRYFFLQLHLLLVIFVIILKMPQMCFPL